MFLLRLRDEVWSETLGYAKKEERGKVIFEHMENDKRGFVKKCGGLQKFKKDKLPEIL